MNIEEHMKEIANECYILKMMIESFVSGHGEDAKGIVAIQLENILGLTKKEIEQ